MLKELLYPLVDIFSAFNIFQYITFRAAYAAVTALFISFIFGPKIIASLRKFKLGQMIRKDGPESHYTKSGTPTMGGIIMILAILISSLLWMDIENPYVWFALISLLGFGLVGFIDDYLKITRKSSEGLQAKFKLIGQLTVSLVIVLFIYFNGNEHTTLLYLPFFKKPVIDLGVLYIPFGVFILVSWANAVNITDGLDGLAIGLVMMAGIAFSILTYITGRADFASYLQIPYLSESSELPVFCFGLVGAAVGFLWFNSHPAEVFMGDTGSLALGGVLGVVSLIIKKEILLVIIGGVFVLELLSVVIQVVSYKLTGKRVFKMAPLHHHFELKGWAETKVVMRFWIMGGMFAILALSTLKIQ